MLLKKYFSYFTAVAMLLAGSIAIFAQTAPVRGKVDLKKADGTSTPVVGALVEVYRTDAKGKLPSARTDKKGYFSFAGFPLGQRFALVISGTGLKSEIYPNIRGGMQEISITVYEGDGKVFTEDEIRKALATGPGQGETAPPADSEEAKKARAEFEKKKAEVEAGNKKIEENNKVIGDLFKQGNEAFNAGNKDLAISKYSEAINIDSSHPAIVQLLTNRSIATRARGVDRYNAAVKNPDAAAKASGIEDAKKDWSDSAVDAAKAVTIIKGQSAPSDAAALNNYNSSKYNAIQSWAETMKFVASKVDQGRAAEMATAYNELLALETDPAKKSKTQLAFAMAAFDSGDSETAVTQFEKILETEPNNIEALSRIGLSLVNVGFLSNDKAKFQNGANYLAKYVELAPEGHIFKQNAKDTLDMLKREQNITSQKPVKTTTTKKKP